MGTATASRPMNFHGQASYANTSRSLAGGEGRPQPQLLVVSLALAPLLLPLLDDAADAAAAAGAALLLFFLRLDMPAAAWFGENGTQWGLTQFTLTRNFQQDKR